MILEAKAREIQIARKRRPLQESGYLPSQLTVMTAESRLIDNGHYMRTSNQLKLDGLNKRIQTIKRDKPEKIVLIKK